ncbi:GNAT family N-acetyltransferase [Nocardioides sp. KIGAM211]|uniref:GNAT family N-acetyltransferase n=1 Tax=Nocardioides luti TaxID=2761101 RepID=A0A7X0RK99_9ACTN|nr:GNAT family N-acetyltransferase [Nocardioides luti]MBB6628790.1 GNAT family N-acetyltransferase [Nocardioides luti]
MSDVEIREVDVHDEPALRVWWETGRAASAERPFDAWPVWEVSRVALPRERSDGRKELVTATRDGAVVGAGMVWFFLADNTHLAQVDVWVPPEHRRRGLGRALLADLEERVRNAGRTTCLSTVRAPVDEDSAAVGFAAALGYPVASHEETKLVDLATAVPRWAALDEEVAAAQGDYGYVPFEDVVPEAYVDDFCALLSAFMGLIPTGDLDLREAEWTPERLHEHEERTRATGRTWVVALAVDPDGRACGFSELGISSQDPRHAEVGGTMVLPEHRGHRLGLGMKLLTHRRVLELYPECAYVETGNAGVNAPMNAVNERLGYRVVERSLDVQKVL